MLPSVLALLSAFAYGAADFLGGLATHRSNATAVVIASQAAGLILLAATVRWEGLRIALGSGVLIGIFLVALARASPASGLWPLIPARVTSTVMFVAIALASGRSIRLPTPVLPAAIGGGALDMLANALYLTAVQRGPLSLMATLASLYPASTILLARVFLNERLSPMQAGGIACAVVATVLLVSG
jgi:uncharacterized membrane protein